MQDCSEAKKPCKGILKTSSSFDRPGASFRKSAKFDELNVLQTYHPLDKDYGHMKIEEPKTPFNYINPETEPGLDANLLTEKLRIAADTQTPSFGDDDHFSDEEFPETAEEKVRRLEFEKRRKAHYNEFDAVRMARKLIEEELLGDDEDDEEYEGNTEEGAGISISSENKSQVTQDSVYPEDEETEGEDTPRGVESGSTSAANSSVSVRPMDVDNEDPSSNPCAEKAKQKDVGTN